MAHPHSGIKVSKRVESSVSSTGSSLPSFLILSNNCEWFDLKWMRNLDSNFEIYEVTILSRYPLTPAKMTQTCSSATIGT